MVKLDHGTQFILTLRFNHISTENAAKGPPTKIITSSFSLVRSFKVHYVVRMNPGSSQKISGKSWRLTDRTPIKREFLIQRVNVAVRCHLFWISRAEDILWYGRWPTKFSEINCGSLEILEFYTNCVISSQNGQDPFKDHLWRFYRFTLRINSHMWHMYLWRINSNLSVRWVASTNSPSYRQYKIYKSIK